MRAALLFTPDQPGGFQDTEVLGHGRKGYCKGSRKLTDGRVALGQPG